MEDARSASRGGCSVSREYSTMDRKRNGGVSFYRNLFFFKVFAKSDVGKEACLLCRGRIALVGRCSSTTHTLTCVGRNTLGLLISGGATSEKRQKQSW